MTSLNRNIVLQALIKHETLLFSDIAKEENLGMIPNEIHLQFLLDELVESDYIHILSGVSPRTYTITVKGINEGKRLAREGGNVNTSSYQ
ncbi:hypothetical protein [Adhaeribacter radiodurans]|uniref:ArsR family transcriptional regulator n=1 Tax=Adhaeribacter radiodurans TaxID=2745197 RepID=A0A7L7LAL4_9BACT|nr:hypothetical protein [Adhaeribacter radiodurans]QMU29777.1 hypothetical protein HUW48_17885 [Adhaeribacter radiodurans]